MIILAAIKFRRGLMRESCGALTQNETPVNFYGSQNRQCVFITITW